MPLSTVTTLIPVLPGVAVIGTIMVPPEGDITPAEELEAVNTDSPGSVKTPF